MTDKCDRCGKGMGRADFDAEHATIHVGTSGTHPERGVWFGDAWYLLCNECLLAWRQWFVAFMGGAKDPGAELLRARIQCAEEGARRYS